MILFGYEIKRIKKVKRVVIISSVADETPSNFRLEGNGWGFNEAIFFEQKLKQWIYELQTIDGLPNLSAVQIVEVLRVFCDPLYKFEIE